MENATYRRGRHGRIQPYAWLGAGAVTLSLGMAMVGGTAVAFADSGANTSSAADAATTADTRSAAASAPASKNKSVGRASRSSVADNAASAGLRRGRASATDALTDVVSAPQAAQVETPAPAAAAVPAPGAGTKVATRGPKPALSPSAAPAQANAAVTLPAPAAPDPSYNMNSFLPAEPIVPGTYVKLAFQNMADAQTTLNQATWGSGNVVAGLASIAPQLFLAQAQASLNVWETSLPVAQDLVAGTVGIPIIHQIADLNLVAVMTLPTQAQFGLGAAALLLPLVNLFGASTTATANLIASARSNGQVYAVIPVQMKATTEPVVGVSIAGGRSVPLLVDTGSSGLITTRDQVGSDLGAEVDCGLCTITYSGDISKVYSYKSYLAVVDFGGGAVTEPTAVNIIDDADAEDFKKFLAPAQVTGILGVGANTYGPGPSIPTTALPGELSDGFLLYQNLFLGVFGVMVFGPNPLPTRVSVPGAPDAYVKVSINGGPKQDADAIIDSGGVYGTLPKNLIGGQSSVPVGTTIAVYTADGETLLYSYRINSNNAPTVVDVGQLMNTGYTPFQQGPIYINYAADAAPGGIGSTDFVWA